MYYNEEIQRNTKNILLYSYLNTGTTFNLRYVDIYFSCIKNSPYEYIIRNIPNLIQGAMRLPFVSKIISTLYTDHFRKY